MGADGTQFLRSVYSSGRGVSLLRITYLHRKALTNINVPNITGTYNSNVQLSKTVNPQTVRRVVKGVQLKTEPRPTASFMTLHFRIQCV
jgi:hypothetical protein